MPIKKLPTKKTGGQYDFQELIQLYYGPPKIGKTTFASRLPKKNLFLATEDGQRALTVYIQPIKSWQDFKDVIALLESGNGDDYYSVTIDTVDNLMGFCEDYVCKKLRIQHMSDEDFGKGWSALKKEFHSEIIKLQNTGIGVIFISHSKEIEVKTRAIKLDKVVPTFSKQVRQVIIPLVDELFYFHMDSRIEKGKVVEERRIACRPSELWEAGDRMSKFPGIMPMDVKEVLKIYNKKGVK